MLSDAESLYSRTGDIKDINTLLVSRGELRAILSRAGIGESRHE